MKEELYQLESKISKDIVAIDRIIEEEMILLEESAKKKTMFNF